MFKNEEEKTREEGESTREKERERNREREREREREGGGDLGVEPRWLHPVGVSQVADTLVAPSIGSVLRSRHPHKLKGHDQDCIRD